jgi:hypothetical protein
VEVAWGYGGGMEVLRCGLCNYLVLTNLPRREFDPQLSLFDHPLPHRRQWSTPLFRIPGTRNFATANFRAPGDLSNAANSAQSLHI